MQLVYFPIAGRGELIRLIAAVGGVKEFEDLTALPDGVTAADCGSAGSMPLLLDGSTGVKMNESTAIEYYVASTIPMFNHTTLTPRQLAKDAQFCALKETCLGAIAAPLFGQDMETLKKNIAKYFPILEGLVPTDGSFINGLDHPTVADLAVLNLVGGGTGAYMPFGAGYKHAGVSLQADYPKLVAHAEKVKQVDSVAKYLATSKTWSAAAFGV